MLKCFAISPSLWRAIFFVLLSLSLSSCAWLRDRMEPEVSVIGLRFDERSALSQVLHADVRVSNPNSFDLRVGTLSYRIYLEGVELGHGQRNQELAIPAGGSADFEVPVTLNLLNSIQLVAKLLNMPKTELQYRLEVDANVLNLGLGLMHLKKSDTIRLSGN